MRHTSYRNHNAGTLVVHPSLHDMRLCQLLPRTSFDEGGEEISSQLFHRFLYTRQCLERRGQLHVNNDLPRHSRCIPNQPRNILSRVESLHLQASKCFEHTLTLLNQVVLQKYHRPKSYEKKRRLKLENTSKRAISCSRLS